MAAEVDWGVGERKRERKGERLIINRMGSIQPAK